MKVRIKNDRQSSIVVVLEPWATEFSLSPGDFLEFKAEGNVPESGFFEIESSDYGITVYPEWEKALICAFDSKGLKID